MARRLLFWAAMTFRSMALCCALLSSLSACGDEQSSSDGEVVDSAAGTVALGLGVANAYRAVNLATASELTGVVAAQALPADTLAKALAVPRGCADSTAVPTTGAVTSGSGIANALVWVEGIEAGKPLPEVRRERVTIEDCRATPRILGVTSGSTINVFSADPAVHDLRFYRENDGNPVARLLTVDEGQVIPSERIAERAGFVEARCTRHPWLRVYIAVFDHPYFALTNASGEFTISQLPPGTYTVKVWREGLRDPAERRVVIGAGGAGSLRVELPAN